MTVESNYGIRKKEKNIIYKIMPNKKYEAYFFHIFYHILLYFECFFSTKLFFNQ